MNQRLDDPMVGGAHPDAGATAAYLDGNLAPAARNDLEAHLSACDECRAGVALLRLRDEAADETATKAVPFEMMRRARALEGAPAAPGARRRRRFLLPAGLAAALLAAAALALWRGGAVDRVPVERQDGASALEAISPARGDTV